MIKKILFTIHFSLFTFFCDAQNYEWRPIIPGIDCDDSNYVSCRVRNFIPDTAQNILWMTGIFDGAAGIQSANCVGYNGSNFIAFPGVMDSLRAASIDEGIIYDGDLIICRDSKVEQFDFTTHLWTTLGTANAEVICFGIYNGDLIAGGSFTFIDGTPANRIAKWNGIEWDSLGGGLTGSTHRVYCIKEYKSKLYAGGTFDLAGGTDAWNIASWDGSNWANLCSSGGIYGTDQLSGNHSGADVLDMEIFNDKLYITGGFQKVCNQPCYLAYWDDTAWHATNYPIWDGEKLATCNNQLYIKHLGGPWISSFDGTTTVSPIDSTFDSGLNDLTEFQNKLYISGAFNNSAATPTFRIARLIDIGNGVNEPDKISDLKIYPNPAQSEITIETTSEKSFKQITITDVLGRIIYSAQINSQLSILNCQLFPSGIYFIKVQMYNDAIEIKKFVKE